VREWVPQTGPLRGNCLTADLCLPGTYKLYQGTLYRVDCETPDTMYSLGIYVSVTRSPEVSQSRKKKSNIIWALTHEWYLDLPPKCKQWCFYANRQHQPTSTNTYSTARVHLDNRPGYSVYRGLYGAPSRCHHHLANKCHETQSYRNNH